MNLSFPKISIVTVSYNQGKYLEKTIQSIVEQNYPNLEYIIIDGGSTDNSVEIIKKYESHLAYWISQKDEGQSDAILKGLAQCTGDVFNWVCSDDYLEPNALFKIGEAFKDKTTDIVFGNVRMFGGIWNPSQILQGTRLKETLFESIVDSYITQPVTFWRMDVFKQTKLDIKLHWYMDYEMWVKYLIHNGTSKVKYVDALLAHYLFHESSKSSLESDYAQVNKASKFKIEMNSIYYSLAQSIDALSYLEPIKTLSASLLNNYQINTDLSQKKELVLKSVNYYVYLNATRYYWQNDFKYALYLFRFVDASLLSDKDKPTYCMLKKRCQKEPVLKYLRKMTVLRFLKKTLFKKN